MSFHASFDVAGDGFRFLCSNLSRREEADDGGNSILDGS